MRLIYITASSKEEALEISRILVSEKLVACCNIHQNIISVYEWENEVQESEEVIIIAKTTKKLEKPVMKRVKSLHSYDCPCIISIKIKESDKDFRKWVETSVKLPY